MTAGNYNYLVLGNEHYYTVKTNLYFSKKKANTVTEIDVNPGKKTGQGYEPTSTINHFTTELNENAFKIKKEWKKNYPDVFTTPTVSSKTKGDNEFTNQKELENYVDAAVKSSKNLYEFNLFTSPTYKYKTPFVILTKSDLKDVTQISEAAEIVKANGKPTVFYEAQIHGKEPAGCEGALAIIKTLSGKYGDSLAEKINVIVIPRLNVDGAKNFQRQSVYKRLDLNRDHLKMQSEEIPAVHNAFNLFSPEIFIDGHEYKPETDSESDGTLRDVLISVGGTYNSSEEYLKTSVDFAKNAFDTLQKDGLRYSFYHSINAVGTVKKEQMVNSVNFSSGRSYYSLTGAVSLLVETRGVSMGKENFTRRALSHYLSVKSILDYAAKNSDKLKTVVENERKLITAMGEKYDEKVIVSLSSGSNKKNYIKLPDPLFNLVTGELIDKNATRKCYYYDKTERSRTRPTTYVIPKGSVFCEDVLKLIKMHNISYYELTPAESATLKQYADTKNGVTLTEEKTVTFNGGAYVFPLNQVTGNILVYLFEPDVDDTKSFNSSFVQSKIITPENGLFPLYRSEQDLTDGKIK